MTFKGPLQPKLLYDSMIKRDNSQPPDYKNKRVRVIIPSDLSRVTRGIPKITFTSKAVFLSKKHVDTRDKNSPDGKSTLAFGDCCKESSVLKLSSPQTTYWFAFGFAITLFSTLGSPLSLLYFQSRYL